MPPIDSVLVACAAAIQGRSAGEVVFALGLPLFPEMERCAILKSVISAVEVEECALSIDDVALLEPVSFSVAQGEALAVTGSNGSGKTTLLRILAGLARPTSGAVRIHGAAIDERSAAFRKAVSGSIGRPPVARDLTLEEHLALVAASWGESVDAARKRAADELERWQLGALRRRFPHELSSGQSQLFALALAVVRPYDVLVLDEPEQRLDSDRLGVVGEVLQSEIAEGRTLVFATHSAVLADAVATRSIRLGGVFAGGGIAETDGSRADHPAGEGS
ncbi:ABC-type multidrug transport system, ATPase component [Agreia pratensis]|uniref:ABC-type multidrug transport system, ATPase component n=1 Tax=Agreia pratensis TaxID=150121 RepID=A0A1X7JB91_9MICO|nr:ABC-type multidrug transport system, ATPase component [Agreia pratensis]